MSRFFYIKSNVKTTTDYRQNNSSSIGAKEFKNSSINLMNSSNYNDDFKKEIAGRKSYSSFMNDDFMERGKNQNESENSVELNFLNNYKNLKKITDTTPVFSSYNLQSKIIAANLRFDEPHRSVTQFRSFDPSYPNSQSFSNSFDSNYSDFQFPRKKNSKVVHQSRTSFLENFEKTQMLIRHNFLLNTDHDSENISSYSVPNIHNTRITNNSSLNKSTFDINVNKNSGSKANFDNSFSSSSIGTSSGVENQIRYDDFNLNIPYDEFQVTHFYEQTFSYPKKTASNLNGIENSKGLLTVESNDLKKRRTNKEKMSIVDSIISKYQPDQANGSTYTKYSDISNNSTDYNKCQFDHDLELTINNIKQKQEQLNKEFYQTKIELQNQDFNQASELSFSSHESLASSVSSSPIPSPVSLKSGYNNNENDASEIIIDQTKNKPDLVQQNKEKSDEAVIYSNGNKKMINLTEKLQKFRSTISIVRKTEEDFGELLKSEVEDEEANSNKQSNLSEIKELPTEALSEASLIFNDQEELHENGINSPKNDNANPTACEENNQEINS